MRPKADADDLLFAAQSRQPPRQVRQPAMPAGSHVPQGGWQKSWIFSFGSVLVLLGIAEFGVLVMAASWNWTMLGIDTTFKTHFSDLPGIPLAYGLGKITPATLIAMIISFAIWRLMPYRFVRAAGKRLPRIERNPNISTMMLVFWWFITLFSVGTNYQGLVRWFSENGPVALPLFFLTVHIAATGLLTWIIISFLALGGDLIPEPLITNTVLELAEEIGMRSRDVFIIVVAIGIAIVVTPTIIRYVSTLVASS